MGATISSEQTRLALASLSWDELSREQLSAALQFALQTAHGNSDDRKISSVVVAFLESKRYDTVPFLQGRCWPGLGERFNTHCQQQLASWPKEQLLEFVDFLGVRGNLQDPVQIQLQHLVKQCLVSLTSTADKIPSIALYLGRRTIDGASSSAKQTRAFCAAAGERATLVFRELQASMRVVDAPALERVNRVLRETMGLPQAAITTNAVEARAHLMDLVWLLLPFQDEVKAWWTALPGPMQLLVQMEMFLDGRMRQASLGTRIQYSCAKFMVKCFTRMALSLLIHIVRALGTRIEHGLRAAVTGMVRVARWMRTVTVNDVAGGLRVVGAEAVGLVPGTNIWVNTADVDNLMRAGRILGLPMRERKSMKEASLALHSILLEASFFEEQHSIAMQRSIRQASQFGELDASLEPIVHVNSDVEAAIIRHIDVLRQGLRSQRAAVMVALISTSTQSLRQDLRAPRWWGGLFYRMYFCAQYMGATVTDVNNWRPLGWLAEDADALHAAAALVQGVPIGSISSSYLHTMGSVGQTVAAATTLLQVCVEFVLLVGGSDTARTLADTWTKCMADVAINTSRSIAHTLHQGILRRIQAVAELRLRVHHQASELWATFWGRYHGGGGDGAGVRPGRFALPPPPEQTFHNAFTFGMNGQILHEMSLESLRQWLLSPRDMLRSAMEWMFSRGDGDEQGAAAWVPTARHPHRPKRRTTHTRATRRAQSQSQSHRTGSESMILDGAAVAPPSRRSAPRVNLRSTYHTQRQSCNKAQRAIFYQCHRVASLAEYFLQSIATTVRGSAHESRKLKRLASASDVGSLLVATVPARSVLDLPPYADAQWSTLRRHTFAQLAQHARNLQLMLSSLPSQVGVSSAGWLSRTESVVQELQELLVQLADTKQLLQDVVLLEDATWTVEYQESVYEKWVELGAVMNEHAVHEAMQELQGIHWGTPIIHHVRDMISSSKKARWRKFPNLPLLEPFLARVAESVQLSHEADAAAMVIPPTPEIFRAGTGNVLRDQQREKLREEARAKAAAEARRRAEERAAEARRRAEEMAEDRAHKVAETKNNAYRCRPMCRTSPPLAHRTAFDEYWQLLSDDDRHAEPNQLLELCADAGVFCSQDLLQEQTVNDLEQLFGNMHATMSEYLAANGTPRSAHPKQTSAACVTSDNRRRVLLAYRKYHPDTSAENPLLSERIIKDVMMHAKDAVDNDPPQRCPSDAAREFGQELFEETLNEARAIVAHDERLAAEL